MNNENEGVPKITQKQWKKLDSELRKALSKTGEAFGLWLFNNEKAKNYIKLKFGDEKTNVGFDLVLRKWGSDSEVICPFCANIHSSPKYFLALVNKNNISYPFCTNRVKRR